MSSRLLPAAFALLAAAISAPGALARSCDSNADCPPGFYCRKPPGQCDGPGVCTQIPEGCGGDFNPVCGCDGVTYSNACIAAANGASIASAGACGTVASCSAHTVCPTGFFCMTPDGMCDAAGVCVPRPDGCGGVYDPVCGCDGMTYSNGCVANAAGVSVASAGPCCAGELDGDGNVGFTDLNLLLSAWGPCPPLPCPADLDDDGNVGFADVSSLLGNWGGCGE